MLQVIPSFYENFSKNSFFIFAKKFKSTLCVKYTVLPTNADRIRFPFNCRNHFIILVEFIVLLKVCWTHSVSTTNSWTVCIHFSSIDLVLKLLSRVDSFWIKIRAQGISITKTEDWTECPASQKKTDFWGKSTKDNCWAPSERPNRRKLVYKSLQTELIKFKRLKSM